MQAPKPLQCTKRPQRSHAHFLRSQQHQKVDVPTVGVGGWVHADCLVLRLRISRTFGTAVLLPLTIPYVVAHTGHIEGGSAIPMGIKNDFQLTDVALARVGLISLCS
jgi:hypothetical protein